MKFEMQLAPLPRWTGLDDMADAAAAAEKFGFEAVLVPSHVYVPEGEISDLIGRVWPEQIVTATHLAARTSTLRIHFAALIVPYLHPITTARVLATLDQVSSGRVDVTIAPGWLADEFAALGVDYQARGRMTDEYIEVMRRLWTEEPVEFSGEFVAFGPTTFEPRCFQEPHVPLWVGGSSKASRRRMGEYGVGWTPITGTLGEIRDEIEVMRDVVTARGRDASTLSFGYHMAYLSRDPLHDRAASKASSAAESELFGQTSAEMVEVIGTCADAGLTHLQLTTDWQTSQQLIEVMHQFAEEVMPHCAS